MTTKPIDIWRAPWDASLHRLCWPKRFRVYPYLWWRGDWPVTRQRRVVSFRLRLGGYVYYVNLSWFVTVQL